MSVSVGEQVRLLLEYGVHSAGSRPSLSELAQATGISDQALTNLLHGASTNPRLSTLLSLCQYYGISLDYFSCDSEDACREYLYLNQVRPTLPLIAEIEDLDHPAFRKRPTQRAGHHGMDAVSHDHGSLVHYPSMKGNTTSTDPTPTSNPTVTWATV